MLNDAYMHEWVVVSFRMTDGIFSLFSITNGFNPTMKVWVFRVLTFDFVQNVHQCITLLKGIGSLEILLPVYSKKISHLFVGKGLHVILSM